MRSGGVLYPIGPQAWPPSRLLLIPQRPSFLPEPPCSLQPPSHRTPPPPAFPTQVAQPPVAPLTSHSCLGLLSLP